ncbi:universal stress protein [Aurantiacibacter poecillastricola]|uniref:universal stress protein n=1 Tax=Aurantiacibacter poecillastricola TaxID=3064385 RepID=UPI00273F6313|nr:universal stress protein [Aurantiacibacter sp. 219JJ12-13]MDP5262503.1 universal stress protein [Aurantiacibacter sp. 219JJ12-13]
MRSILVHAIDDSCFEARLQAALDLARIFDAHITVMQTIAYDLVVPMDPYGVSAIDVSEASLKKSRAFREKTEARLGQEDVRWDWHAKAGYEGQSLLQHAALNDLALVGGTIAAQDGRRGASLAGMLAVHCRTPIMVVPESARGFAAGRPATLCWNGSMEAARAMRAAVPLLQKSSAVHILTVGKVGEDDDDALPALAAATYLERHDVDCEIVEIPATSEPVPETLRKAAEAREAGLMVMGAYGQPRIVETLFGGVTRSVLSQPPMPVLMAH